MAGLGGDFSQVLNLTLKDVEEQLGATEAQLRTMDMEEILKQLYTTNTLDTLPSFMRAPSWQQQQQQTAADTEAGGQVQVAEVVVAPAPTQWEAAAAGAAAAALQQQHEQQRQQQAAAAAAAQQQQGQGQGGALSLAAQLQQGGMMPLSSLRMDQIFSWYAENQAQAHKPQAPAPTMTLHQLFDTAGLQLAPPHASPHAQQEPMLGMPPQKGVVQQQHAVAPVVPGQQLGGGLAPVGGSVQHLSSLHLHAAASLLPPGMSPAGPFASESLPMLQPPSLAPQPLQPQSLQPPAAAAAAAAAAGGAQPPKNDAAAAARAARARKRKDTSAAPAAGPVAKAAAGLSAAEAARQALEVAERAAAELAELPQDLGDREAKAIKRAIKNRESAARSRAKRQEYTATLEQQVEELKQQNLRLRHQVIAAAAAPPDPHAAKLDGELLRRSRTGPI